MSYDFTALQNTRSRRTLWDDYESCLAEARAIVSNTKRTSAAYCSVCKLCHWYSACIEQLVARDDLTLIPELGRPRRDAMISRVQTIQQLAASDPRDFISGDKTIFPGIGPEVLRRFHTRAQLQTAKSARPILRAPVSLPTHDRELFFDVEFDPMRDVCYLHGFIERRGWDNATERFVPFFAEASTPAAERAAFAHALAFLRESKPCAIYYYSRYERTVYRRLRDRYPELASAVEIEELFDPTHAVDLYNDVVRRATEWPTWDFSIKTLATYLGFSWRDAHPSGTASIEWFDRWIRTQDPGVRQRILDYNEDDCRATRVLLDRIRVLASCSTI